jgi:CubicO group peptidase (beta-lactamase class C family)
VLRRRDVRVGRGRGPRQSHAGGDARVDAKSFGFADVAARKPVTNASVFALASGSKPITAMAIFKLIDDGKTALDTRRSGISACTRRTSASR